MENCATLIIKYFYSYIISYNCYIMHKNYYLKFLYSCKSKERSLLRITLLPQRDVIEIHIHLLRVWYAPVAVTLVVALVVDGVVTLVVDGVVDVVVSGINVG